MPVLNKQPILEGRTDLLSLCDTAVACGWGAQEENTVWFLHCKRKMEKWNQGTLNQRKGKYRAAFISISTGFGFPYMGLKTRKALLAKTYTHSEYLEVDSMYTRHITKSNKDHLLTIF